MPNPGYPGRRRAGSVRFAPYFKLQWFDETVMAWRDVQQSYPSAWQAREASVGMTIAGRIPSAWRVMEITMHGRVPLAES
jgi:hypothetical protein